MNALREPHWPAMAQLDAESPLPALAAPMQKLVARLLHLAHQQAIGQLMMVGAGAGVGNSLVARQTALHLCAARGPVLLVQVRDAALSSRAPGTTDPLAGPVPGQTGGAARQVHTLELDGAQLMHALSCHARVLPADWLATFGLVVWDLPDPVNSPLSLLLAPRVDGIVLTAQAYRTRKPVAAHAASLLQAAGGRVLGVVLNRTRRFIPDWLYRWL